MYHDFDLNSVLNPTVSRKSYAVEGCQSACNIMKSSNRSTEDMIAGAVTSLGTANRHILYVQSSLEALDDRLDLAASIAKPINIAVAQGAEGFSGVKMLNPWEYATEGKAKEFFKRIWEAIKTGCRRIIDAIAYIIRWIGNAIAGAEVKAQIKDYEYFVKNRALIDKAAKAAKVADREFQSLDWAIEGKKVGDVVNKFIQSYIKVTRENTADTKVIDNASRVDLKLLQTPKDFANQFSKIFGISFLHTEGGLYKHAVNHVNKMVESINNDIATGLSNVFGKDAKGKPIKELVLGTFANGTKVTKMTCGKIRKLSGDFSILSAEWLANNVKKAISTSAENQKLFTTYTKAIDQVAKKFESVTEAPDGVTSLSTLTAKLANARIRYNSIWNNVMLEVESACLRYRKSAYIAMKQYIRAARKGEKADSKEGLSQESLTSLFNSLNDDLQ